MEKPQPYRKPICPFMDKHCMGETCALWTPLTIMEMTQFGIPKQTQIGMCAFRAMTIQLSTKPQAMPIQEPISQMLRR